MGNPKQKWTPEEEEALRKGIEKHGAGKWKNIQKDPEFNHLLYSRSNIDLKDKWRNLTVSANGPCSREKSRTQKLKLDPDVPNPITPIPIDTSPVPSPAKREAQDDKTSDVKNHSRFDKLILDAILAFQDPNGSDSDAIVGYIKKGPNGYRMKNNVNALPRPKLPNTVPVVLKPVPVPTPIYIDILEAASDAAYRIAEAENKSFVAAEAVKEAERVAKLAEQCESVLLLAKEIFERCVSKDNFTYIEVIEDKLNHRRQQEAHPIEVHQSEVKHQKNMKQANSISRQLLNSATSLRFPR